MSGAAVIVMLLLTLKLLLKTLPVNWFNNRMRCYT